MNPESAIPGTPNPETVLTAYPESTFPGTAVLETLNPECPIPDAAMTNIGILASVTETEATNPDTVLPMNGMGGVNANGVINRKHLY